MDKTLPPNAPALTLAQAMARINHLRPIVMAARDEAFQKCPPGLSGLAQDLMLYDDGIFSAEATLKAMRERLGIVVTPESLELAHLHRALYLGRFQGAAPSLPVIPILGAEFERRPVSGPTRAMSGERCASCPHLPGAELTPANGAKE